MSFTKIPATVTFPAGEPMRSKFSDKMVVSALFEVPSETPGAKYNSEYDKWEKRVYAEAGTPKAEFMSSLSQGQVVHFAVTDDAKWIMETKSPQPGATVSDSGSESQTRYTTKRILMTPDETAWAAVVGAAEMVPVIEQVYDSISERLREKGYDDDFITRIAISGAIHGIREHRKVRNDKRSDSEQAVAALADDFDLSEFIEVVASESEHFTEGSEVASAFREMNISSASINMEEPDPADLVKFARIAWRYAELDAGDAFDDTKEIARTVLAEFNMPPLPDDPIF